MISIYFGLPRAGKSTLMAKMVYERVKVDPNAIVFTNVPVDGAFQVTKRDFMSAKFPSHCTIIWDEAGIDFNNRDYKELQKAMIEFLKLHGHHMIDEFIFLSQSWDDVDITIRRLAQEIKYIRKIGSFTLVRTVQRFIFMDERYHQITSGYKWMPLWYWLFYPFWRLKPCQLLFRPFYYGMFDSYSLPNGKPPIYLAPWTSEPLYNKWQFYADQKKTALKGWFTSLKGMPLKWWLKTACKLFFALLWLFLFLRSCAGQA